jgi:hypothetical protein
MPICTLGITFPMLMIMRSPAILPRLAGLGSPNRYTWILSHIIQAPLGTVRSIFLLGPPCQPPQMNLVAYTR